MLPAPRFLFVLVVTFGSVAAILLLRKKLPNKKIREWTPWILATLASLFIIYLVGAAATGNNRWCGYSHETNSQAPEFSFENTKKYFDLGNYHYDIGNCDAAIENYSKVIFLDPNYAAAYNNRAYTYMMMNDYKDALLDLDRAIELRPDYVNALMNRGDIYNFYYNVDKQKAMEVSVDIGYSHEITAGHWMHIGNFLRRVLVQDVHNYLFSFCLSCKKRLQ